MSWALELTVGGGSKGDMLENLDREIRDCYRRAERCARRAQATGDERLRADYLRLEESWLKLARSHELRQRLTLFINEAEIRRRNDLNQGIARLVPNNEKIQWELIATAPFDRDLELAVLVEHGAHALVFPCRRILGGWVNSLTSARIEVRPTHWREWKRQS